jgi:hypothetical protein
MAVEASIRAHSGLLIRAEEPGYPQFLARAEKSFPVLTTDQTAKITIAVGDFTI